MPGVTKKGSRPIIIAVLAMLLTGGLLVAGAAAQGLQSQGTFKDWRVYSYSENGKKVCFAYSEPRSSTPKGVNRGDIYIQVTNRPAEGTFGVVSIDVGYPFKDGSDADVQIGGDRFDMFTSGQVAWAHNEDDPKLVASMRRGSTMTVKGESSRGTRTTDTYSLSGFTAATNKLNAECPR